MRKIGGRMKKIVKFSKTDWKILLTACILLAFKVVARLSVYSAWR